MGDKTIRIACTGSDLLPLDAIEDFQGGLKKRDKKQIEQIITSILRFGFSFPFCVWNGTGHNYCIDGHGRIAALSELRRRGYDLPIFPVVYIDAKDEAEAKQKLLRLTSQYGVMTIDSMLAFSVELSIDIEELALPNISMGELRIVLEKDETLINRSKENGLASRLDDDSQPLNTIARSNTIIILFGNKQEEQEFRDYVGNESSIIQYRELKEFLK
jgi:hypothetical protein